MKISIPKGVKYIAGVDEVGRGPLAGPATVCVFVIARRDMANFTKISKKLGITDSKQIYERKRAELSAVLCAMERAGTYHFHIASSPAAIIDTRGIVPAIRRAMNAGLVKLCTKLGIKPHELHILLDGSLYAPDEYPHQQTIIRGDGSIPVISAASILAKVHRDRYMTTMDRWYPGYDFAAHKGYGTKHHRDMIKKYGLSKLHRRSFCKKFL